MQFIKFHIKCFKTYYYKAGTKKDANAPWISLCLYGLWVYADAGLTVILSLFYTKMQR